MTSQPAQLRAGRMGGRAVAILIDEGLSSLQNFLILFAGLHYLSVGGVGAFTLAYTGALIIESTLKSLLLEPLSIRFSAADRSLLRVAGSDALGAALVVGALCLFVAVALSLATHGEARAIILATGLMIPMIIVQEGWRVYFFACARPWGAVINDFLCLVATLILVAVVIVRPRTATPATLLVLWALGTGVGAAGGIAQARLVPSVRRSWRWLHSHWDLGSRLAGGSSIEQLAGRVSLTLVSVVAGTVALGQFAAARTLVAPATTVVASALNFAVPEAVRIRKRNGRLDVFIGGVSVFFAALLLVFGAVLHLAPDSVGALLAGKNWETARMLLLPVVIASAALAARQGPRVGLRVFERPKAIFRLSCATAIVIVLFTAAGAWLGGASGAAWLFASAHVVITAAWWMTYLTSATRRPLPAHSTAVRAPLPSHRAARVR